MKTVAQLFKRHGLMEKDLTSNNHAHEFLENVLISSKKKLYLNTLMTEEVWLEWLKKAEKNTSSIGPGVIDPEIEELPLSDIDTYIRGVVRWLNLLGVKTMYSCDGHGEKSAFVLVKKIPTSKQIDIIQTCAPHELIIAFKGNKIHFEYPKDRQKVLLDFAEKLYNVWIQPKNLTVYKAAKFKRDLLKWLSIPGVSGNERFIRTELERELSNLVDYTYVDKIGNLLAVLNCGDGPTILLSAHMDLFSELKMGRKILQKGTILSSSKGILGADDRAGIAAILELVKNVRRTNYNGTIKIAFTVQEEVGCFGSANIDKTFLEDVDGAIVFDRRGNRDIVTSYNNDVKYCSINYGKIFEKAGKLAAMTNWKQTSGGSSDTKEYASFGIPSVNLSVGYKNEHTESETLDYLATYQTVKLVEMVLHHQLINKRDKYI